MEITLVLRQQGSRDEILASIRFLLPAFLNGIPWES